MRVTRRFVALFVLIIVAVAPAWSMQDSESIVAHAKGNGLLKFGDEEFKVTSVIIKLFKDGKAEINLITDLTIFVSGTWSRDTNSQKIKLKITGGATGSGVEASGELTLRGESRSGESRSVERVFLEGQSKTTHRKVTLKFQAAE
jgi:hypothetical protein